MSRKTAGYTCFPTKLVRFTHKWNDGILERWNNGFLIHCIEKYHVSRNKPNMDCKNINSKYMSFEGD
jgi:hypothetical protein